MLDMLIFMLFHMKYIEKYGLRRYGFHGTSHKYVSERAAKMLNKPIEELKIVSCHLGNGASICAVKYGKSIETSIGLLHFKVCVWEHEVVPLTRQ